MKNLGHFIGFVDIYNQRTDVFAHDDLYKLLTNNIPGKPRNANQLIKVCKKNGFHYEIHHPKTVEILTNKGVEIPSVNLGKHLR